MTGHACRTRSSLDNTVSDLTSLKFEPLTSRSETKALPLDQLAVSMSRSIDQFEQENTLIGTSRERGVPLFSFANFGG